MSKAEEFAYSKYPKSRKGVLYDLARNSIIQGYQQAEKDLLENEHEKSWRLDKKLWKGIKGIERASYQYMYDASNDWAYDIPTWEDVQDAFKAGSEWKEDLALTIEDIKKIHTFLYAIKHNKQGAFTFTRLSEEQYQEVLNRFNKQKGE